MGLLYLYFICVGRGSSVVIAIGYMLDDQVIEFPWRLDFPYPSRTALGSTQSPVQWVPDVLCGGQIDRPPAYCTRVTGNPLWAFMACSKVSLTFASFVGSATLESLPEHRLLLNDVIADISEYLQNNVRVVP
jgi:hypothetical protein